MIKSLFIAALAAMSFSAVAQETTVHREVTRVERQQVERHVDRDMERRHDMDRRHEEMRRHHGDRDDRWDNGRRGHERTCVMKKRIRWVDGHKVVTKYRHCDNGRRHY